MGLFSKKKEPSPPKTKKLHELSKDELKEF